MKLRTPADSSRAAHYYDREFGTSRAGSAPSMLHETIALREASVKSGRGAVQTTVSLDESLEPFRAATPNCRISKSTRILAELPPIQFLWRHTGRDNCPKRLRLFAHDQAIYAKGPLRPLNCLHFSCTTRSAHRLPLGSHRSQLDFDRPALFAKFPEAV
jgi:hypothetical protein